MFLHNFKYELKVFLRSKPMLLWLILFPIVLGTLFKIAFGSIYEKTTVFSPIPTAIVETEENQIFQEVLTAVSGDDGSLLDVTRTDEETALAMLKNGDVEGILYVGDSLSLTVAGKGMPETILKSFVEQYGVYETLIRDVLERDPMALPDVIEALSADVRTCKEIPVTQGNPDQFIQYFYNLIAMVAMFGSMSGIHITELNQANLSPLGARKNCSPTPKSVGILSCLAAQFLAQAFCMGICVTYLAFVLKIDFGDKLPLVYAAAVLGGCLGVTFGFFIGSVGRAKASVKEGICVSVSMILCFLSGLMVGNMKAIIAEKLPWFNAVNPVAIVSDSFYCLNLYSDTRRFGVKILSMLIYTVLFSALGILFSRRKKYASL